MSNTTVDPPLLHLSPWERIQLHPSIIVFCLLLLVVGVPGNSLILYIYTKRININICGFFIKTLAVIDLINSIGVIPAFLVSKILPAVNARLMCKCLTFFHNFSAVTTGVLYVVIALQRFKKICRSNGKQLTETFAKKLTFFCILFSIASGLPLVFMLTNNTIYVERKWFNETKVVTVPICVFTETSKHLKLSLVFPMCLLVLLVFIITSLAVLYSLIWRHVKTSSLKTTTAPQFANRKGNKRSNVTKMFFILAVIYTITVIPRLILAVYFNQPKKVLILKMARLQIFDFVVQLPYLNCVVNPFIYGFSSKRFRNEVVTSLNIARRLRNTSFTMSSNIQMESAL